METVLTYLLTAIFVFSVFHYIYESIIVPSERMLIRDELFQIRDKLRGSYSSFNPNDKKAFDLLHDMGINHSLNNLSMFNLLTQIKIFITIKNNPSLEESSKSKVALIESAKSHIIRESFIDFKKLIDKSYLLNSGGWTIYVIPVVLTVLFTDVLRRALINSVFSTNNAADHSSRHSQCI